MTLDSLENKISILRLIRTKGIGYKTFFDFIEKYNNASDAIINIKNKFNIISKEDILNELEDSKKFGIEYVFWFENKYPKLLLKIDSPPPVLTFCGNISILNDENFLLISVVGSRNASIYGKKFTEYICEELLKRNFHIISGMANGIDNSAHNSVCKFNLNNNSNKTTVAILGSGIKNPYPSKIMFDKIRNLNGCIISQFHPNEEARKENFLIRNRIIAGLSHATLVIEAKERSGSIITAKYAVENGRLVFAIPGFPMDENSRGTNNLIKEGAILVRDINDILNEINEIKLINNSIFTTNTQNYKKEIEQEFPEKENKSVEGIILGIIDVKIPSSINQIANILISDYNIDLSMNSIMRILIFMESSDLIYRANCGGFLKI